MPAHEHRLRIVDHAGAKRQSAEKKTTPWGNDIAVTMQKSRGTSFELSFWDVWFTLVAERDFDGDLDQLAKHLKEEDRHAGLAHRSSFERKLSHLRNLQKRLVEVGVSVNDVVPVAGHLVKSEMHRARVNVLEEPAQQGTWSEAMRKLPRKLRRAHALSGHWPRFPVSPKPYADKMRSRFKRAGFYTEDQSFDVADRLESLWSRVDPLLTSKQYAEALALLRAWLTVVIQVIEMADDSYGCIADRFDQGFGVYLKIPLKETGIEDKVFFEDLLDFLIWEDYGQTRQGIKGYFRHPTPGQGELCIDFLRQQIDELRADDLDYQSKEALRLLGQVVAEQGRYERFADLAGEMGSSEWPQIIHLADHAMKRRKRKLAMEVFEVALAHGPDNDLLTRKYEQLKRGEWNPDPNE